MKACSLAVILHVLQSATTNDSCKADGNVCAQSPTSVARERYSASANEVERDTYFKYLLSKIKSARSSYRRCNRTDCSCISSRLGVDLAPWRNGIQDRSQIENAVVEGRGVLYQVVNRRLYRSKECKFPSRCEGIEYFLLRILPQLSDVEFVLNDSDYPQSIRLNYEQLPVPSPIFSFSKDGSHNDILYPAWSFWAGGPSLMPLFPEGLGRWDLWRSRLRDTAVNTWPWEKKESKGFFRGSRTSDERDPLILVSRSQPKLIDAAYTKNQAWKSDADTLGQPAADEVGLEEHCKFKFLFNFRGVAASFRLRHLFLCRSAVFHVGSDWIEFFYDDLKPWLHYIPIPEEADKEKMQQQIIKLMNFAQKYDGLMKEIADEGADFVERNLDMKHIECYWRRLLRRYARLLKYKVTLDKNMKLLK